MLATLRGEGIAEKLQGTWAWLACEKVRKGPQGWGADIAVDTLAFALWSVWLTAAPAPTTTRHMNGRAPAA